MSGRSTRRSLFILLLALSCLTAGFALGQIRRSGPVPTPRSTRLLRTAAVHADPAAAPGQLLNNPPGRNEPPDDRRQHHDGDRDRRPNHQDNSEPSYRYYSNDRDQQRAFDAGYTSGWHDCYRSYNSPGNPPQG
jgi:hypothetical protein